MRIGLAGVDSSHAEDFLRHFNHEKRHRDVSVTAVWDHDGRRAAELLASTPGVLAAETLEQLIGNVDAVIVGARHGDLHLRPTLAAIGAGKPVFVDKPLACSVSDAAAMVDAAEQAGTPLLSGSALRWQDDVVMLKARLAEVGTPMAVEVQGTWYPNSEYGGAIYYGIHTIEMAQELLGAQWGQLSIERGDEPVVRYQCGRASVTLSFRLPNDGAAAFGVSVASPQLTCETSIVLPDSYMAPVTDQIVAMLRSGRSGMDRDALLGPVRLMAEIETLLASA